MLRGYNGVVGCGRDCSLWAIDAGARFPSRLRASRKLGLRCEGTRRVSGVEVEDIGGAKVVGLRWRGVFAIRYVSVAGFVCWGADKW
jgi:hypothetical protein